MQKTDVKKLVLAALIAAFGCVVAIVLHVHIPVPGAHGYLHPGDVLVILSGVLLGPGYGGLAAGIGFALADLVTGHTLYVPVTFVLRYLAAAVAGVLYVRFTKNGKKPWLALLLAGVVNMLVLCGGYLLYEGLIYGFGTALLCFTARLVQTGAGLLLALLFYPLLMGVPEFRRLVNPGKK